MSTKANVYDGLDKMLARARRNTLGDLSYFRQKTPTSRNVKGYCSMSRWEMNVGWR